MAPYSGWTQTSAQTGGRVVPLSWLNLQSRLAWLGVLRLSFRVGQTCSNLQLRTGLRLFAGTLGVATTEVRDRAELTQREP